MINTSEMIVQKINENTDGIMTVQTGKYIVEGVDNFAILPLEEYFKLTQASKAKPNHEVGTKALNLQRVIARFFKNMNEKRQARIHRRTLSKVTACSNCGSRLTRCRCGQRRFQIEILDRALNGL